VLQLSPLPPSFSLLPFRRNIRIVSFVRSPEGRRGWNPRWLNIFFLLVLVAPRQSLPSIPSPMALLMPLASSSSQRATPQSSRMGRGESFLFQFLRYPSLFYQEPRFFFSLHDFRRRWIHLNKFLTSHLWPWHVFAVHQAVTLVKPLIYHFFFPSVFCNFFFLSSVLWAEERSSMRRAFSALLPHFSWPEFLLVQRAFVAAGFRAGSPPFFLEDSDLATS